MARLAFFSLLVTVFSVVQVAVADSVPSGTYRFQRTDSVSYLTDSQGQAGAPVVQLPLIHIAAAQKWDVLYSETDDTVTIQSQGSKLYLSMDDVSLVNSLNSTITVETEAQKWRLIYSANKDAYFIQYPEVVQNELLVVDDSLLRLTPTQLALRPKEAYQDTQTWTLTRV
ncbi:hypothetical protein BGZ51_003709 [Haplosporangium sp. Z 767]|nr:hypothetical protein BGZ51_003709 [Haplosporangium sp. Z 767]KAF9184456.1 hypothetical protein BGZ50_003661 [Haplosporangium sp. Z 11]